MQTLTNEKYLSIVNAKLFIDENYHEPIDLELVSKKAFISKFHFHRLFRRIYKKTSHEYITGKRVDKTKALLTKNKPVSDVCNEVGFESIRSFSILLKRRLDLLQNIAEIWHTKKDRSIKATKEI